MEMGLSSRARMYLRFIYRMRASSRNRARIIFVCSNERLALLNFIGALLQRYFIIIPIRYFVIRL